MSNGDMSPLVVVVSGGGPVGLTFSINLTMMMGKKAEILIYDGRWFVDVNGITRWREEEQGNLRREQVVTLQDNVIEQLPKYIQNGLFKNINERVWPKSRNIPIREVEDRLFELIQPFVQAGQIKLVAERLDNQSDCIRKACFDILIGADGPDSFVRKYSKIPMVSEGIEYACGVAFNIPLEIPEIEKPLHQALNCILTGSQTRFLVNSSYSRSGYLNIRLIKSEFNELKEYIKNCKNRNEPCKLPDYNNFPSTPIWTIIRQGLEYFKIASKFVTRITSIKINVCYSSAVVRELRLEISEEQDENSANENSDRNRSKNKTVLACLIGDAALDVHFWSGRGMNSGMKAAIALGRNIFRSSISKSGSNEMLVRTRCPFLKFLDYEGFMARLRARELQGRSLDVLNAPIDPCVIKAYFYIYLTETHTRYTKKLIKKLKKTRNEFEELSDWPHKNRLVTDEELESASKRISPIAIAQLSLAKPSPPREFNEVEILVEDTFPFDPRYYLPVPMSTSNLNQISPSPLGKPLLVDIWQSSNINGVKVSVHNAIPFEPSNFSAISTMANNKITKSLANNISSQMVGKLPLFKIQASSKINDAYAPMEDIYTYYQENLLYAPIPTNLIMAPETDYYILQ